VNPNIMIKQMYDVFGRRKQSHVLYMGDVCQDFTMSLLRSMEAMLDKHSAKKSYYMYIHARFDAVGKHTVRSIITILPGDTKIEQFKTLGTMCFFVDNRIGEFKKLWVLPYDRLVLGGVLDGKPNESIAKDSIGMPVKGLTM